MVNTTERVEKKRDTMGKVKKYFMLHAVFFFYSFTGILSKLASSENMLGRKFWIYYFLELMILFIYAIVWQQIMKRIALITAYANRAVLIIWGLVWGCLIFGERVTFNKVFGAIVIIIGMLIFINAEMKNEYE